MAQIRLIPSTYAVSNTEYVATSNPNNALTNTDSTSYGQFTHNNRSNTTYYVYLRGFNFNDVPSNAIINSFTVKIRGLESALSTSYYPQLCNNTTAINNTTASTAFGTSVQTITIPNGNLTWDTITGYGANFGIRVPLRRAQQRTSGYVRIYGAEILVDYTIPVYHNVSVTNNSEVATVTPSSQQSIIEGEDCVITFSGIEDGGDIIVKDNGTTVELLPIASLMVNPSQLIDSNGNTGDIENGLTDTASTTYAYTNGQYNHYLLYGFDLSMIPQNAVINSVSCVAKVQHTRTTASGQIQLYAGSTAKGSVSTFGNTVTTVNLTTGTWTREELNNIRIRIGNNYNGGTTTYETRFYGANLTVNYSSNGTIADYYTYTISNINADHTIVVEDASVTKYTVNASSTYTGATVSPSTQEVREGRNATVTVSVQNLYEINITDNGVDIKNSLVGSNGTYTYTLTTVQTAHTISVSEATYYNLVASSSHDTATISPATMKAYQGQNAVFIINGNVSDLILKDNGIDVTSSISNGSYTITNVTAVHTLTILNKPADFVKIDGSYRKVGKVFKKIDGVWIEINKTAFDDFVSTNIMMYGGNISISEIGNVETNGEIVNININNNALSTGTYKLIYEDEHREPLDNVDKITEFTI